MPTAHVQTVIEQQRSIHEEIERLEQAMVEYYLKHTRTVGANRSV